MAGDSLGHVPFIQRIWQRRAAEHGDANPQSLARRATNQALLRRLAAVAFATPSNASIESSAVTRLASRSDRACAKALIDLEQRLDTLLETDFPVAKEHLRRCVVAGGGPLHAATLLFATRACNGAPSEMSLNGALGLELLVTFPPLLLHVTEEDASTESKLNNTLAILIADFAVSRSLVPLSELPPSVVAMTAELACSMSEGAAMQLQDLGNRDRAVERYFGAARRIHGAAFALAASIGARLAQATPQNVAALERYGHELGMAFAISSDIRGLLVGDELLGERPGLALAEGRYGLPVIYALEAERELRSLLEKPPDGDSVVAVAGAVQAAGGVEKALATCRGHVRRAQAALRDAGGLSRDSLVALAELAIELTAAPQHTRRIHDAA